MTPPRVFRILGQKYVVKLYAHLLSDDGKGQLGSIDHDLQEMRLATHQARDSQADTYLHELLHAVLTMTGYGYDAFKGNGHEEMVVRLTPVLLHTLRDNPRVVAYLMEKS